MCNITTIKAETFTKTRKFLNFLLGITYFNYNLLVLLGIKYSARRSKETLYIHTQQYEGTDTRNNIGTYIVNKLRNKYIKYQ